MEEERYIFTIPIEKRYMIFDRYAEKTLTGEDVAKLLNDCEGIVNELKAINKGLLEDNIKYATQIKSLREQIMELQKNKN